MNAFCSTFPIPEWNFESTHFAFMLYFCKNWDVLIWHTRPRGKLHRYTHPHGLFNLKVQSQLIGDTLQRLKQRGKWRSERDSRSRPAPIRMEKFSRKVLFGLWLLYWKHIEFFYGPFHIHPIMRVEMEEGNKTLLCKVR